MNKRIILKKPPAGSLRFNHPWIYRSQIQETAGGPAPGDLVDVSTKSGRFVGRGYWNPRSEISVRLLIRQDISIDRRFFQEKFQKAFESRKRFVRDTNAYRLVSSEADDLPGLIVDQYAEVLVLQFLTLGMEKLRPMILEALEEALPSKGIYERSDSASRRLEGLEEKTGWIQKSCGEEAVIHESGAEAALHFGEGHKTGWYLDQRENRLLLKSLMTQGEVLDAFCYEGAFGLHLALAGCRVMGIDIQKENIRRAEEHRKRNHLGEEKLQFKTANAFDTLKELDRQKAKFDLVILDPPSFVKKKSALEGALSGYKEILLRSMKILNENGLLAVFSCSYHVDDSSLMQISLSAAMDARKSLRAVRFMKQSADHPINPFIPETYYLKGFLFEVRSMDM